MLMGFGDEGEDECGDINSMRFGECPPAGHGVDFDDVSFAVAADEQIHAGNRCADNVGGAACQFDPLVVEVRSPRRLRRG